MSAFAKLEIPMTVELSTEQIARAFSDLDDDAQAQFFVHVARLFAEFPAGGSMQTFYIARHLRDCECSTIAARDWVKDLAESMLEPRALSSSLSAKETAKQLRERIGFPPLTEEQEDANLKHNLDACAKETKDHE